MSVYQYLGEVRLFTGDFAPSGWVFCDGRLLSIAGNEALHALLGEAFGGDGRSNFGVPDLRGRAPVHASPSLKLGQTGGAEFVNLSAANYPQHTHPFNATTRGATQPSPAGNVPAQSSEVQLYTENNPITPMAAQTVLPVAAGGQHHGNVHPFQALNFIMATEGIFPPRG